MKRATIVFAAILCAVAAVPNARATNLNHHGIAFKAAYGNLQQCVQYPTSGISFSQGAAPCNGSTLAVTASIEHNPLPSGASQYVYIDGKCTGNVICCVTSFEYNGTFLGQSCTNYMTGTFEGTMTLTNAQVSYWGYEEITCALPPGPNTCTLYGFDVTP